MLSFSLKGLSHEEMERSLEHHLGQVDAAQFAGQKKQQIEIFFSQHFNPRVWEALTGADKEVREFRAHLQRRIAETRDRIVNEVRHASLVDLPVAA